MYIEASVAPDCRSARNNLYSGIPHVSSGLDLYLLPMQYFPLLPVQCFPLHPVQCFSLLPVRISDSNLLVRIGDPNLPFAAAIPIPVSGHRFQSPFPVPVLFPVSDSISCPVPFPVPFHVSDSVPFPVPFHISDSVPRSSILNRPPFRSPFRIPFPSHLPRGSASSCFSLCSRAALLYIEGSA